MFPISPMQGFISACLFGSLSAYLAYKRGRNPYLWFFLGALFGIFGIMAVFFAAGPKPAPSALPAAPEPAIQGPKDKFWYYLDPANQQYGPMSHEALTSAWKEGKVGPSTFVWNEEWTEWKPLGESIK